MTQFKVTAIGEILFDIYPDEKRFGGAPFNFIYHVWKILGKANFISAVGNDENGKEMLAHLNSIGFDTQYITIDNEHPTGTVNVVLDENKIPRFTMNPICCFDYMRLNDSTRELVEHGTDLLYFGTLSSRNKIARETTQSLYGKEHLKYFCDLNLRHNFYTKELVEETLYTCNVIKINYEELEKLRTFFNLPQSDQQAIEQLVSDFNIDMLTLTLGEGGAEIFSKSEFHKYKSKPIKVVDTLGAGDAYAAILCIGYLNKLPIAEINKLANEFAAEICMVEGAIPKDDSIYKKYREIFSIK